MRQSLLRLIPSHSPSRRFLALYGVFMVILIIAIVAVASSKPSKSHAASSTDAPKLKTVNSHLVYDSQIVAATIQNVEIPLGEYIQNGTAANAENLARVADEAHTRLTNMKDTIAVDGNDHASLAVAGELYGAVNDLKNSMGAIGTFLANPNPTTVASFTNQFDTAVNEWNTAVADLYKGKAGTPPTIPTN